MGKGDTGGGGARKPVPPKEILEEQRELLALDGKRLGNPEDKSFATGREKQKPGRVLGKF